MLSAIASPLPPTESMHNPNTTHLSHLHNLQLYVLWLLQASCGLGYRDILNTWEITLRSSVVGG